MKTIHTCSNILHIAKIRAQTSRLPTKSLIPAPGSNLLAPQRRNRPVRHHGADSDPVPENARLLRRYLANVKCNITVWGSTVVELEVKPGSQSCLRGARRFLRRFRGLELRAEGRTWLPNALQLSALRPQTSGSDLLINAPKGAGKTFMYLLPHLLYQHLLNGRHRVPGAGGLDIADYRLVVLLPTIDLVVEDSRAANACLRRFKKVAALLYRDLALNELSHVMDSDLLYSTPKSFLKLLLRAPALGSTVRFVVVDESERMVEGEFATLLVRIRDLLPRDSQVIFLSNFPGNQALNLFTSRFSKLNFKIISYLGPGNEGKEKGLTRHIYGPIRSASKYEAVYEAINSTTPRDRVPDLDCSILDSQEPAATLSTQIEANSHQPEEQLPNEQVVTREDIPAKLDSRIRKNLDLILGTDDKPALNDQKIEFALYEPSEFAEALLREISRENKTLVYFPTVRMCQFCYVYFKHYLQPSETRARDDAHDAPLDFAFYAFHTGLSLEKRRFVLDNFKLAARGALFCTNLALGLNFRNVTKVVQVAFSFNVYELLGKFSFPPPGQKTAPSHTSSADAQPNPDAQAPPVENLLLLSCLDGHALFHYYKNNLNVTLRKSRATPNSAPSEFEARRLEGRALTPAQLAARRGWADDPCLVSSCELMYRSLLGLYSENALRLRLERWTIPSFLNELVRSFGLPAGFPVSRQFAARTQLLDAPGLEVSRASARKSDLVAALKSYPGFLSKSTQALARP